MENKNPEDKKDKLRKENEEIKKQLEEEFGATKMWANPDLPPEMENEFFNNIMAFENAYKDVKRITVYEFLGNPPFRPLEELQPEEVEAELNRVMELMNEHQITLDTLCDVPENELYRFITEELFLEDKDDIRIPGMISHYTYEEFHPNHEYDINRYTYEFMTSYLDKSSDLYVYTLSTDTEKQEWHKHFRETFSKFEILHFEIDTLNYSLESEEALVVFDCDIKASVEGSQVVFRYTGKGELRFVHQWDYWYVDSVEFPKPVTE